MVKFLADWIAGTLVVFTLIMLVCACLRAGDAIMDLVFPTLYMKQLAIGLAVGIGFLSSLRKYF